MYTSYTDKFAVLIRYKDEFAWRFVTLDMTVSHSEIEECGLKPENYLFNTFAEAQKTWTHMLVKRKEHLAEIKLSKMNRYNLEKESEVIGGFYREFK